MNAKKLWDKQSRESFERSHANTRKPNQMASRNNISLGRDLAGAGIVVGAILFVLAIGSALVYSGYQVGRDYARSVECRK